MFSGRTRLPAGGSPDRIAETRRMNDDLTVGVDLGGSHVKAALVDTSGAIVAAHELDVDDRSFASVLGTILTAVREVLAGQGISGQVPVGIGSPGNVDLATGTIRYSPNLFWHDAPLGERLRESLHADVYVANDARCATLGEFLFGAGRGVSDFALLTLGTGIGGGIVSDGRFVLGHTWAAAEVGHHQIRARDGFVCNCGKTGCFEAQASATGLIRHALAVAPSFPRSAIFDGRRETWEAKPIIEGARAGDPHATRAWNNFLDDLAVGVANVIAFTNPERIALGGGVSAAGAFLLDGLNPRVDALTTMAPRGTTALVAAQLGNDAGIIGAAQVARQGGFSAKPAAPAGA
jgi:glucokinase